MTVSKSRAKRHKALQPFSRDHHHGLVQARRLEQAADAPASERRKALDGFRAAWESELADHFACEERWLLDLIPREEDRGYMLEDHALLRLLAVRASAERGHEDPDPALALELGRTLHDHIRWEERELFPSIEKSAGRGAMIDLERATREMESRRDRPPGGDRLPG